MTKQELGPDDLRQLGKEMLTTYINADTDYLYQIHRIPNKCATAWQSDRTELAAAKARIAELEKESTAYREAMTLRPMESAPRDGSQFVALIHRGDDWSGVDDPEGPKWHCCYYHQDRYGEALMMQQKPTNYRCLGWLPLPTPINEGE